MLDVATRLKNMGAKRIFAYASYPLFTNGLAKFDEMAEKGIITKIFGTNLTYRTPELLTRSWYADVDVSKYIAYLITALNHDISTAKVIDPHTKIIHLFEKHGVVINKIS
jgi:ribose-phosphate pyrophosphokinase